MKRTMVILSCATALLLFTLLFWDINPDILLFSLKNRSSKIWAILVTGSALGVSTLVFQTVVGNRILSPGILGLDNLYLLINLLVVVMLGTDNKLFSNSYVNFAISCGLMALFSTQLYIRVFTKIKSIYKVILLGVVMGTLFSSITGMLQISMNPDTFNTIMDKLFASYNVVNKELLAISSVILIVLTAILIKKRPILDVLSLGKDKATNLGVDYIKEIKWVLILVFILISVSTALVGPVTFLGFFAANLSRTLLPTYKHSILLTGAMLSGISTLFLGQILVEHLFDFGLPIGALISLWGGIFFIFLILRRK